MKSLTKRIYKAFTKQNDQSDCGVTCLLIVIKFFNGCASFERLRELSGTSKQGTTLLGLYQAAKSLGFDTQGLEAESVNNLKELSEPAILHVLINGKINHYIVFFGFDEKDNAIIADPANGILKLPKSELDDIWKSKALLKLSPNNCFNKEKNVVYEKWIWFKSLIKDDINILIVAILLGIVISVFGISTAIFSQVLIDKIIPEGDYNKLIAGIVLVALLLIIKSGLSYLRGYIVIRQNMEFNNRVVAKFYSSLLNLSKSFFDTRKVGDMIARMNDVRRIQNTINVAIGSLIIDILVIVIYLTVVFFYSKEVGLIICSSFILFLLITLKFHGSIVSSQKGVMQAYSLNESNYIDTIQGIESIKSNNKETFFIEITKGVYNLFQQKIYNLGILNIKYGFFLEFIGVVLLLGIFATSAYKVLENELQVGEMVALLSLAGSILPAINRIPIFNIQFQEAKVAFDRMYEFSSIKPELINDEDLTIINFFDRMNIEGLCFRYNGRKQLLKNISLEISTGEFIAILGESGTGKSTLIQILQRFYKPEKGSVFVNGTNLDFISTKSWRDMIGVVSQQIKIFNSTLIENICLDNSKEEIINVQHFCKQYGFDVFFNNFPQGYSTVLGEEGTNISGGEKQLVALARALYRKPKLLILDEATSAMDRNTENYILSILLRLKNEIAIIMVTHRIKTSSKADKIYILEKGTIEDFGTPKELMLFDNYFSLSFKELIDN